MIYVIFTTAKITKITKIMDLVTFHGQCASRPHQLCPK